MRACILLALLCAQPFLLLSEEDGVVADTPSPFKSFGIELDLENRQVRVDAAICCTQGVLEYVICLPSTFEHEALVSVKCKPSILHLGLLAIGLEPCSLDGIEQFVNEDQKQRNFSVNVEVEYLKNGQKTRCPISDFMAYRNQEDKALPSIWVFTGSFFGVHKGKPVYAADVNGGVVGLRQDRSSVLQFGEDAGNPYENEEQGFEVNTKTVPEKGTKVQLIFTAHKPKPVAPPE